MVGGNADGMLKNLVVHAGKGLVAARSSRAGCRAESALLALVRLADSISVCERQECREGNGLCAHRRFRQLRGIVSHTRFQFVREP